MEDEKTTQKLENLSAHFTPRVASLTTKYAICSHRKHMFTQEKYIHVFLLAIKHEQAHTQTQTRTQQGRGINLADFLRSVCGLRHTSGGIESGCPAALKVPTDSQLLHHTLHPRPRSFSNTQILQAATWRANIPLISVFTFTALL